MNAPKWQRARLLDGGKELWVEVGRPQFQECRKWADGGRTKTAGLRHNVNLIGPDGIGCCINPRHIELLARDEADFAEFVELQSYEDWLKGDSHDRN